MKPLKFEYMILFKDQDFHDLQIKEIKNKVLTSNEIKEFKDYIAEELKLFIQYELLLYR